MEGRAITAPAASSSWSGGVRPDAAPNGAACKLRCAAGGGEGAMQQQPPEQAYHPTRSTRMGEACGPLGANLRCLGLRSLEAVRSESSPPAVM